MRRAVRVTAGLLACGMAVSLGACATVPPSGPTVMALPGPGKSFPQFQQEDYQCRVYAQQSTAYVNPQTGTNQALGGAAIGTLLGAAAGAAIGAAAGNAGAGAAIGAGTGLVGGTAVGASNASATQAGLQQEYNVAYTQCMYSYGDTVQSPPPAYSGYGYPYPAYGYGYPYPAYGGPNVVIGLGGGYGWGRGWGYRGGGWGWNHWH